MINFAQDSDILNFEAILFGELYFANQVVAQGTGTLNNNALTDNEGAFIARGIMPGGVVTLRNEAGDIDGSYGITTVTETTLQLAMAGMDGESNAAGICGAGEVQYRVSTYGPQIREASFALAQYFGLMRDGVELTAESIKEPEEVRQVCVLAVLAGIYATLASNSQEGEAFWKKSYFYQKLFQRARERVHFILDDDNDGHGERTITGNVIKLVRG